MTGALSDYRGPCSEVGPKCRDSLLDTSKRSLPPRIISGDSALWSLLGTGCIPGPHSINTRLLSFYSPLASFEYWVLTSCFLFLTDSSPLFLRATVHIERFVFLCPDFIRFGGNFCWSLFSHSSNPFIDIVPVLTQNILVH